ncbi:molybdopterin molybdotransferase MoeA [Novosphingobium lentum]|uniref:molybdopterin molybdotransferase MoeA n=1 Tax=Novosphingobium lentum TaxID=145287 RepID=UPI00082F7311|nr:molybdopterin molybdotransferase MoeA [Novosphingobium lentum]
MKTPPLTLAEAQSRLLALAPTLAVDHREAADCAGFYLAETLTARRNQPAAPMSAMDGYALRSADAAGPWQVVGESAAGHPFAGAVGPGQAVRIATGAVVPAGADTVLLQEDCVREQDRVMLAGESPRAGRHIRPSAMDFAQDADVLAKGTRMGAAQLALAIAAGHRLLPVRRKVRLAIIDSGDELRMPGDACAAHQIPASNGPMLAAMAASLPCTIERHGPIADRRDALVAALEAAASADIVVTSGGASVGDHDLVRPALAAIGAELDFWRVAIKPGKPLLVARRGHQLILGLPGNPASAYVTGFLFMLPLLRAALGSADPPPRPIPAQLATPMDRGGSRMEFLRAVWNGTTVAPLDLQDSGALTPLAHANALIVREAGADAIPAGSTVPVYLLENGASG